MLSWLIHAAKHSNDPSIGLIQGFSKWGDYGNEAFWAQVLLDRGALLIRRHANKIGEDPLKQEVSPRTSGRLSHNNAPLNSGSLTDSLPVSPFKNYDLKVLLWFASSS